uniref:Uncharacterized protein n=1 Tax=Oryza sativa subsp. japonica TaxID=39947 RepID=Q69X96_ORYSJ|nr:hypothetical protein [Oryza sativa Japonica Group]
MSVSPYWSMEAGFADGWGRRSDVSGFCTPGVTENWVGVGPGQGAQAGVNCPGAQ